MDDAETAAQYRRRAAELLQIAEAFKDHSTREEILTLAAEWKHLADRAEARAKRWSGPR
jgi:hypothetical protein